MSKAVVDKVDFTKPVTNQGAFMATFTDPMLQKGYKSVILEATGSPMMGFTFRAVAPSSNGSQVVSDINRTMYQAGHFRLGRTGPSYRWQGIVGSDSNL